LGQGTPRHAEDVGGAGEVGDGTGEHRRSAMGMWTRRLQLMHAPGRDGTQVICTGGCETRQAAARADDFGASIY